MFATEQIFQRMLDTHRTEITKIGKKINQEVVFYSEVGETLWAS